MLVLRSYAMPLSWVDCQGDHLVAQTIRDVEMHLDTRRSFQIGKCPQTRFPLVLSPKRRTLTGQDKRRKEVGYK